VSLTCAATILLYKNFIMLPQIVITKATVDDIPYIQHIAHITWPLVYGPIVGEVQLAYMLNLIYSTSSLEKQMENGSTFLLAKEDSEPKAFAAYFLKGPHIYKLDKLYALPNQQGKGLGKMLVNYIIDEIRALGATALHLNVNRYNTKAQSFYEHLNFKIIEEQDIPIGEGYFMNDYVMKLKL
jgi:ribosomal protein S18 acetylase RimI-like enzyme